MALQLKKRNFKLSSATTGALLIGAGLILIKTFPHIKSTIESAVFGQKNVYVEEDENKPVEVNDTIRSELETSHPALNESAVEVSKWSDESLKSYLFEVR